MQSTVSVTFKKISDFTAGGSRLSYVSWAKIVDTPPTYKSQTIHTPYTLDVLDLADSTIRLPETELPKLHEIFHTLKRDYGVSDTDLVFLEFKKNKTLLKAPFITVWSFPNQIKQTKKSRPIYLTNYEFAVIELDSVFGGKDYTQISGPILYRRNEDPVRGTYDVRFKPAPYTRIPNVGFLNIPEGSSNTITYNDIENGRELINFQGEYDHNRYYTKNTFNTLAKNNQGLKTNPYTKEKIRNNATLRKYKARVSKVNSVPVTNKRNRKTRKTRRTTRKQ